MSKYATVVIEYKGEQDAFREKSFNSEVLFQGEFSEEYKKIIFFL